LQHPATVEPVHGRLIADLLHQVAPHGLG
jgi:hypothetical protein